jgi:hypothetical protein
MIKHTRLLLVCCIFLVACSKQQIETDLDNPMIELVYPKDIPALRSVQPLCVKTIVTDNAGVSSLYWEILDVNTGKIKLRKELSPNYVRSFVVEEKITLPAELSGEFNFRITAGDRIGNTSKMTIPFSMNN